MLSACASSIAAPQGSGAPVDKPATPDSVPPLNSDMDARLMYRILAAEIAHQSHAFDIAFALMLEAAKSRHDDALYQRAVVIASEARAGKSALKAAQLWQQGLPESLSAMRQTLGLELALDRPEEAAQTLARLFKATPLAELAELSTQLPAAMLGLNNTKERRQTAEAGLRGYTSDPKRGAYAHAVLGTLALQDRDTASALTHAQAAARLQPNNSVAATLAVALLEQGKEEARALVLRYLDDAQAAPQVRMFYIRERVQTSQLAEAMAQLKRLTESHPEHREGWLLLGRLQLERHQYEAAQESTQRALRNVASDASPDAAGEAADDLNQRAWLQLAQIAQDQGRWDEAAAHLARVTAPSDELQWLYQQASLQAAQGHLDQGMSMLQRWKAPDDAARLRQTWREVNLLREHGTPERSYQRLEQARIDFPQDNDLLYTQAMVAEQLGNFELMEELLRQHITRAPNDHQARNALGYSLADRKLRLHEAKALIEEALQRAPNDPFVVDSKGWVLFRLGQIAPAIEALRQAWRSRSDAEIAAHLGEVLWSDGQQEAARTIWAQGLALDANNRTLRDTLKRLQVQP